MFEPASRRTFLKGAGLGAAALGVGHLAGAAEKKIQGFEEEKGGPKPAAEWKPVSDRKIRMGIVGYGLCKFGPQFSLQDHPNVEVVAVSDLFPDRCAELAKVCRCEKTYPSLEKMVEDDSIEAIFCATDAPGHARHAIDVLKHGKHVATAVPAVYEHLEDGDKLFEAVKQSGLNYMLFETSYFHSDLYAMRQIYQAGGFGELVYTEGEYYHYACAVLDSYKDWRIGMPPQFYPTHSNAYQTGVDGGGFSEGFVHGHAEHPRRIAAGQQSLSRARTPSAPRSPCSARPTAGCLEWVSVGTRRATAAKSAECAARGLFRARDGARWSG